MSAANQIGTHTYTCSRTNRQTFARRKDLNTFNMDESHGAYRQSVRVCVCVCGFVPSLMMPAWKLIGLCKLGCAARTCAHASTQCIRSSSSSNRKLRKQHASKHETKHSHTTHTHPRTRATGAANNNNKAIKRVCVCVCVLDPYSGRTNERDHATNTQAIH